MKVLLTGYTGFLGRYLAEELIKDDYSLRVIFHRHTITKKELPENVEVIWGSIDSPKLIKEAVNGIDCVIHCAWAFNSSSEKRPTLNERAVNLLFSESVQAGIKKFVFISSVAVYGMNKRSSSDVEESYPFAVGKELMFSYPLEKIKAEKFLQKFNRKDTQLAIFRPGPIFDDFKSPLKKIMKFGPLNLGIGIGTGRNRMAYIHAKDVAQAVIQWLKKGGDGAVLNIVPSECLRAKDWIRVWGLKNSLLLKPVFVPGFMLRLAGFGMKILKRMLGRKSSSDVKYAVACAKRDMSYSNKAIKNSLNWEDKATLEYVENRNKKLYRS